MSTYYDASQLLSPCLYYELWHLLLCYIELGIIISCMYALSLRPHITLSTLQDRLARNDERDVSLLVKVLMLLFWLDLN